MELKTFKDIKVGDTVYCIEIENSTIVDDEIKAKMVKEIAENNNPNILDIFFEDGSMIIPYKAESHCIRGMASLANTIEPFNFKVYACNYEVCLGVIKDLSERKIKQITEEYNKVVTQLTLMCKVNSTIKEMARTASKREVITEVVYAD